MIEMIYTNGTEQFGVFDSVESSPKLRNVERNRPDNQREMVVKQGGRPQERRRKVAPSEATKQT